MSDKTDDMWDTAWAIVDTDYPNDTHEEKVERAKRMAQSFREANDKRIKKAKEEERKRIDRAAKEREENSRRKEWYPHFFPPFQLNQF